MTRSKFEVWKKAFYNAEKWYQKKGKHSQDRIRKFEAIIGLCNSETKSFYEKMIYLNSREKLKNKLESKGISYYQYAKKYIIKYQKENPKYRIYKRRYEKSYREDNRLKIIFTAWRRLQKRTVEEEMNYLLKRMLK